MNNLRIICAEQIARKLDFPDFVEALRQGFSNNIVAPLRHHHEIEKPGQSNSTLLLMPAWTRFDNDGQADEAFIGVKIVTVTPDNALIGKKSVQALYLLNNGNTGEPVAIIDGQALTYWRTACASALASSYLSRENSSSLMMIGAGALAPWLIRAHMSVRPIDKVLIWNRNMTGAEKLVDDLAQSGIDCAVEDDLQKGVSCCDIVSAATLSTTPLIRGTWLAPGTHVDLVGGFTPAMREADDEAIGKADLFADTIEGVIAEAGDITQPLANGTIRSQDILADLFDLCTNRHAGRDDDNQITLFKSVGTPLEDLAAAILIAKQLEE